jgi:hypothetical protein
MFSRETAMPRDIVSVLGFHYTIVPLNSLRVAFYFGLNWTNCVSILDCLKTVIKLVLITNIPQGEKYHVS